MDVTCERCGTEYEFDETLVSDRGTTVKCTNCGHLFKVYRPGAAPGAAGSARTWLVRQRDGTRRTLRSLRELQHLIAEGTLTEDDEISRSGEGWKPLGAIAELHTFFAAAQAASASAPSRRPSGERRDATMPFPTGTGPGAGAGPRQASSIPPPSRPLPDTGPGAYAPTMRDAPMADRTHRDPAPSGAPRPGKGTLMGVGGTPAAGGAGAPSRTRRGTVRGVGPGAPSSIPPPPTPAAAPPSTPPRSAPPGSPRSGVPPAPSSPPSDPSGRFAAATPAPTASGGSTRQARPQRDIAPTREASADELTPEEEATPSRAATRPGHGSVPPMRGSRGPQGPASQAGARPLYLDEAEEAPHAPSRGRTGLWVGLVALLVLGLGVGLGWQHLAPALGIHVEEDAVGPLLDQGGQALVEDHEDAYRRAIREYTRASGRAERDVRVLGSLAQAHALLAQTLDFRARDLDARAGADPTRAGEAAALRRERDQNAEEARHFGEDAVRLDPNHLAAVLALADALRLTGDLAGAQSHLERARSLTEEDPAELHRVAGLLAMAEADGNVSAAEDGARAAVEADPSMHRARLLLARALLADGNVSGARSQIDAVLSSHPDHPQAVWLRQAIEEGLPPAAPAVEVPDAGVPEAGDEDEDGDGEAADSADEPTPTEREPEPAARTRETDTSSGGVPPDRDYSWYIREGDERLERGDVGRAREHFEAALGVRPSGSEALVGMGYVLLETGNASTARERFDRAAHQGYAPAYIGLGEAYRALGQNAQAARAYESYLERLPNGPHASIARTHLERLQPATPEPQDTVPDGSDPGALPAPEGTDPSAPPPGSDPPAVDSEPLP